MTSPSLTDSRGSLTSHAELFRALGVLVEPPAETHGRLADLLGLPSPTASDWTEAFVVQLVPHASIYVGEQGMLGGEAADRVAGFWRALRLPVPSDPDHLTSLLGLYASLLEKERDESEEPRRLLWRQARFALLHEHLLSWLPPYLHAMAETGIQAYVQWACLLDEVLCAQAAEAGVPNGLPVHLRDVPAMPALDEGLDPVMAGLLTPARSGLLLTRAHLTRVARQGGLGLRLGDRRRVLRALIEQDPATALGDLAGQARAWAVRHRADEPVTGATATYWAERATATAELLTAGVAQLPAVDAPDRQEGPG